jgi:hypothetical protein
MPLRVEERLHYGGLLRCQLPPAMFSLVILLVIDLLSSRWRDEHEHEQEHDYEEGEGAHIALPQGLIYGITKAP